MPEVQDYKDYNWKPRYNPWIIALTVTLATFMEVLDTSIANVALPHIAGGLSASQDESTWVLTSYLVSNAIVLPMSGWLTTVIGRKRFYMTCVMLFTISSVLCGFAPVTGDVDLLPYSAGRRRRRHGSQRAGYSRRYLSSGKARARVLGVWHGGCGCTGHRPNARWLDYRQL